MNRSRFFKKTRFNWKYILGEITLIFLGISLAIWFNNWNERVKLRNSEISVLKEIKSGLLADKVDLGKNLSSHRSGAAACDYLRDFYLGKNPGTPDSLSMNILLATLDATSLQNTAPYEYLKSKGIALIRDDSLRKEITHLYEYEYFELRAIEERFGPMQFYQNFADDVRKYLGPRMKYSTQNALEVLPRRLEDEFDVGFILLLRDIRILRNVASNKYEAQLKKIDLLVDHIEEYLTFVDP